MLAVFVNCGAVLLGSLIGILFSKKFNKELNELIQTGAGIVVVVIGLQMALKYENIIYLTLSVILGGLTGTWWKIDDHILNLGKKIEKFVFKNKKSEETVKSENNSEEVQVNENPLQENKKNFAYAFLNASVLFCVGAMAIIGSLKAGIEKDYSIIFTKSILDGFMAISFAAAMGIGTAFSAITIFIYQGALTLLSTLVQPYCSNQMINELTGVGGALIVMIGINLLGLKKIKTANFLPAMIYIIIFVLLDPLFKKAGI